MDCSYQVQNPTPHCLRRDYSILSYGYIYDNHSLEKLIFDEHASFFYFSDSLRKAPRLPSARRIRRAYNEFSDIESPNDPIFFLILAQVDRIWTRWQQARTRYGKSPKEFNGVWGNRVVSARDELKPLGANVEDVLDSSEQLGYVYAMPGTNLW